MFVLWVMVLLASQMEAPPTVDIRDGTPVKQQYLRGNPAYLAVGVLVGVSGSYQESGSFDKVYLFKQGEGKQKDKYSLVGTVDVGYINGVPAGLDLASGDVDGDKHDELGVSVREGSSGTQRNIGMLLYRCSETGLLELWHLDEGTPQMADLDYDGRAEVGQFGRWEQAFIKDMPVQYLEHIYRWKGQGMVLDDTDSGKIFHTAREKAQGELEIALVGKGNSDGAFRAAAEVFLVGKNDPSDLGKIWKMYEKSLQTRLNGEQWSALKKLKP